MNTLSFLGMSQADIVSLGFLVVAVLVIGLMLVSSNRKRRSAHEQITKMHDELRTGQRVRTVGGVVGRIKEIREESREMKTVLLETGSDKVGKSFMLFDIQAIYGVVAEEGHTLNGAPIPKEQTGADITGNLDAREYVEKRNSISKRK